MAVLPFVVSCHAKDHRQRDGGGAGGPQWLRCPGDPRLPNRPPEWLPLPGWAATEMADHYANVLCRFAYMNFRNRAYVALPAWARHAAGANLAPRRPARPQAVLARELAPERDGVLGDHQAEARPASRRPRDDRHGRDRIELPGEHAPLAVLAAASVSSPGARAGIAPRQSR